MKQKPPDNDRDVLTLVRESDSLEYWYIDSWDGKCWFEASYWDQKVLYWQELPKKPDLD